MRAELKAVTMRATALEALVTCLVAEQLREHREGTVGLAKSSSKTFPRSPARASDCNFFERGDFRIVDPDGYGRDSTEKIAYREPRGGAADAPRSAIASVGD